MDNSYGDCDGTADNGPGGSDVTCAARAHYTVWSQAHDAFTDTTEGAESTTCSGFNGLHDKLYDSLGTYSITSDVDSGDGGPNTHVWQELWVR